MARIAAIGEVGNDASEIVDAGGLALMPGIIDLHTHYDAQSPGTRPFRHRPRSGSRRGHGNCGFGIVPAPRHLRDLIMRTWRSSRAWTLIALRAGIDWRFSPLPNT